MSIWQGIDRAAFQSNVTTLGHISKNGVCFERPSIERGPRGSNQHSLLSAEHERRLATDFAFLSCTTTEAGGIAAAAVQWFDETQRLRITLAANSGIPRSTSQSLTSLLCDLAKRAKRQLRSETFARCQSIVIDLHHDRIMGRLGLSAGIYRKPFDMIKRLDLLM
jgi:hypothetical protein